MIVKGLFQYFWNSNEAMRVGAITNTAARLIHGDTLHAMCKLPFNDAQVGRRRSADSLRKMQETWESTVALGIDEISMVKPLQLFAIHSALGQAKRQPDKNFGDLALWAAGDFMQLPPVGQKKPASLAAGLGDVNNDEEDRYNSA